MWTVILVIIIVFVIIALVSRSITPVKRWHQYFTGMQISAHDFYARVEQEVIRRDFPHAKLYVFEELEKGIFSAKRQYLRVTRGDDVVDIGCALFGKEDSFVSWWYSQKEPSFISKIPILNTLMGVNPKNVSFYQQDTATMFRSAIHSTILFVIDEFSETKGYRPLSELDRQPIGGK